MTRRLPAAVAALALALSLTACESDTSTTPTAKTPSAVATTADIVSHESGPDSPIAYDMRVPRGATQLGPLVRYRSQRLIEAYQADLQVELDKKAEAEEKRRQEAIDEGRTPPTPRPTPTNRPSTDTYRMLDERPRPDVTVSVMRVDGDPSDVVHRMLGQIATVLPNNSIDPDDLETYCPVVDGRFQGCHLRQQGLTGGDRKVRITLTVSPGVIKTRTAYPSSDRNPVMVLTAEYTGDPREGQEGKETEGIGDMPPADSKAPPTDAVWPRMDLDAPSTTKLLGDTWTLPAGATMLLSSRRPQFAMVETETFRGADQIAREWVASIGKSSFNTVEDLNEISTTYTARRKDGVVAQGTYVVSGRGSYALLMLDPPTS